MDRYAGPLLGVGLLLAVQLVLSAGAYVLWCRSVRRSR